MTLEQLKIRVLEANQALVKYGLVTLTWGNVSGIDRQKKLVVIKPSGIPYSEMSVTDLVTVNLDGRVIDGKWKPSTDTPTHLALYRNFPEIRGIAHTHSQSATAFAQACREIPCLGTTHADHFCGPVPVTRFLTKEEVENDYELNTGLVIVERFRQLNPLEMPAVLVAGHAPFTWGRDSFEAVDNSLVLEKVAEMAFATIILQQKPRDLPEYIKQKHFGRKHGSLSYYGQKSKEGK